MKKLSILVMCVLVLTGILVLFVFHPRSTTAQSLDNIYGSPINGGCYIAGPGQCKLHVDPFIINIDNTTDALLDFTLYANGSPIYDFKTDASNPPRIDYSPSTVALDFAATCGTTYYINLVGRSEDFINRYNLGLTTSFTCPSSVP